jgi:cell shape-determining protein MreC
VVIVILLFVGLQLLVPHFIPAVAASIFSPFWRTEFSVNSGSLRTPSMLLAENEDLKRQLADDQIRVATIQDIENQNADLKALMGRASSTPRTLAAVLRRPPASGYDELVIDIGSDANVSTTSLVYAVGNVLIGRVSDALGQTSKVTLFSSPGQKYDVLIGTNNSPATAVGRGGGQYQAEVSRDVKVAEGDMVVAPSLNDHAFGIVTSVISDPAQPFKTILFAPPVNVYQLRWVLVDTGNVVSVKKK